MWIRWKHNNGRWDEATWVPIDLPTLTHCREAALAAFKAMYGEAIPLGFTPRSFTAWAIDKAGITLRADSVDQLMIHYASYQRIQHCGGDWQAGPDKKWITLPNIYPFAMAGNLRLGRNS